jgi:DNA-binding NarL/FixJ family response regulator
VCKLELGDAAGALAMMRSLGGEDVDQHVPVERCFDWESLALAQIALGDMDAADALAARAEQHAERLGLNLSKGLAARTRAAVLLAGGDAGAAAAAATTSCEAFDAAGAPLMAAFSRSLLGKALASTGERAPAVEALRHAEKDLDRFGSVRPRDEARRELRKLGARSEVRGPASADESGVGALSKREREIADLITDRLTNPEIAEKLFLSKKTVESHVRNLFVKLSASSRVEVARIIERERRAHDE